MRRPQRRAPRKARSIRVEDALWDAAMRAAERQGDILSEVIREALERYIALNPPSEPDGEGSAP